MAGKHGKIFENIENEEMEIEGYNGPQFLMRWRLLEGHNTKD